MTEIPDSFRSLFSAQIEERDGSYVVDIPSNEVEHDTLAVDETYRIAILASESSKEQKTQQGQPQSTAQEATPTSDGPPVNEGEVCNVTIETTGDQGDVSRRLNTATS